MSGISSTLSIAKTAIAAQQYGLAVTGHNIANVNNPDYSMQIAEQLNRTPALYAGHLFGTGVDTSQIAQNVDSLLEERLTKEKSTQAAFEEAEGYMNILEGYFDENSDASITSIMIEFWNSWHDLADNPLGSSERVAVYEKGSNFASRLNKAEADITTLIEDINNEINAALDQVNSYTRQIADLNVQITGLEANRTANDLRDSRNALVDKLGLLIDIDMFEQTNGSLLINAANGSTLVTGVDNYELSSSQGEIMWQGSFGADLKITDRISGGRLAGWLDLRDEILPKFSNEVDILAREMIWAMNYQHSQGSGLEYFSGAIEGYYEADQSGLFSSYDFGDKIDYTQDFTMWMQDNATVETRYTRTQIDMGISEAEISNWQGTVPGGIQSRYELTVMDGATLGDKEVIEMDGRDLSIPRTSTIDVADALNSTLAEQTITVNNGPSGTEVIEIKDMGGNAQRSAASIAEALSAVDGVDAYASKVSATFDTAGIAQAQNGDEVQFSLYVDGIVYDQKFTVNTDNGNIPVATAVADQFENALRDAANAINDIRGDQDLFTSGFSITSSSGRTIGVQDFEVLDNTSIRLDTFNNFTAGDTVTFTVTGANASTISFDLGAADVVGQAELTTAFYNALSSGLAGEPLTVEQDPATNSIILRTTDGSNLAVSNGGTTAANATLNVDVAEPLPLPVGTVQGAGNNALVFDGTVDSETFGPVASTADSIDFIAQGITESIGEVSNGGVTSAVIAGTVTIVMDPGMTMYSNVAGDVLGSGGLFNGNWSTAGGSIMTLGGEGGFSGFAGSNIAFEVDGTTVTYNVGASTTEDQFATGLAGALGALSATDYTIVRNGLSVSIIKNKNLTDPIEIKGFRDTGDGDATLSVTTGAGSGTSDPQNDLLEATVTSNRDRTSATSSLFADSGIIKWEKFDADGIFTGETGLIDVDEVGTVSIVEADTPTLSFDVSAGTLVAGNTLTINTDRAGVPDPLNFSVSGAANNKNEIYKFSVTTGGKIGELVADEADTIRVEWKTNTGSGFFELEGTDPVRTPGTPLEVEVDGMTLKFYDGTVFENDVFTITTDASGIPVLENDNGLPTGELLSDWHWTIDSFAERFNRQSEGMVASTTMDNRLKFDASKDYHAITNVEYSGKNGFNEDNVTIAVKDWSAIDFRVNDLQFVRSSAGGWGIVNDPTGGIAAFIPDSGDDDGFGIDFSGDGLVDIEISFTRQVSGDGFVQFDLEKRNQSDISFAFSDDSVSSSSGLLAAAGINHFFVGNDAKTMDTNQRLTDTKYVAAGRINSETGQISNGDNTNAIAMSDIQYKDITMKQWDYNRGSDAKSSLTTTSLDGFYATMTGSMGIIARRIQSSREFADIMVNNLTEQRNSVSAVSLDEEMIKLMKYQHGFSAASKLLSVSDEMLNTLIAMR